VPAKSNPPAPENAVPPIVEAFISEFAAKVDKEYALLEEYSDGPPAISLFDLQMETLIFGLHCLDRAVFARFGAAYRSAFMDYAFATACEAFAAALPDDARDRFLESFEDHCYIRQQEYGKMKLLPGEDGAMKNVLVHEFTKRICIDAGVYNPPVQLVLMEWANGIAMMMLEIAEKL
jgi:hypothetical protein